MEHVVNVGGELAADVPPKLIAEDSGVAAKGGALVLSENYNPSVFLAWKHLTVNAPRQKRTLLVDATGKVTGGFYAIMVSDSCFSDVAWSRAFAGR